MTMHMLLRRSLFVLCHTFFRLQVHAHAAALRTAKS